MDFESLENQSFNSFDPDMFDPEMGANFDGTEADNYGYMRRNRSNLPATQMPSQAIVSGKPNGAKTVQAQFDLTITASVATGNTFVPFSIELFNSQRTQTKVSNTGLNNYIPVDSIGLLLADNGANLQTYYALSAARTLTNGGAIQNNIVGFDRNGDLLYIGVSGTNTIEQQVRVSCPQIPYRALLEYLNRGAFRVAKTRITYSQADQINNDIVWTHQSWLGSFKSNRITPRTYFRPDQFQNLIVDIPARFDINSQNGLQYFINAGTTTENGFLINRTQMNFFVEQYVKANL